MLYHLDMAELHIVSQEELTAPEPAVIPDPAVIPSSLEELCREGATILLLDRSGSFARYPGNEKSRKLVNEIIKGAATHQNDSAIYGFSGAADQVNLYEYKRRDSNDLNGLKSIDTTGGGGSELAEALGFIGKQFDPSQGGTLLIHTDAYLFDIEPSSAIISDLRQAGLKVFGLLDPLDGPSNIEAAEQLFGPGGYALVDDNSRLVPNPEIDRPALSSSDLMSTPPCPCAHQADASGIEQ